MNAQDLMKNLLVMALADGEIAAEELTMLADYRNSWGISADLFARLLADAESSPELQIPAKAAARRQMLTAMAEVMAADGKITELEMDVFATAAKKMEIPLVEQQGILDEVLVDDEYVIDESE